MQILHAQSLNFSFRLTTVFILKLWSALGYFTKTKQEEGGGGGLMLEFPRGIKERDSMGQLKKKWNFQQ